MERTIITAEDNYKGFDRWIAERGCKRVLLVCGNSLSRFSGFYGHLRAIPKDVCAFVRFSDFAPNPSYESAAEGVKAFRENECDGIVAVGGGSAIDVAKCIKLYSGMDERRNYLEQEIVPNQIPFLAMPTTAGSGSEATRFAVIYYGGVKQSVTHESCIPDAVLLDSETLKTLPAYQRKSGMMDAFCHSIESCWSIRATPKSRSYSQEAIARILANMDGYLSNTEEGNQGMLLAAHTAGQAIDLAQTTAGHAMCYGITGLFHVAHGHAAALCDRVLFPWMTENAAKLVLLPGGERLDQALYEIATAMGCLDANAAARKFLNIFSSLRLDVPRATEEQFEILRRSVNPVRLKNHPVALDERTIDMLYRKILNGESS